MTPPRSPQDPTPDAPSGSRSEGADEREAGQDDTRKVVEMKPGAELPTDERADQSEPEAPAAREGGGNPVNKLLVVLLLLSLGLHFIQAQRVQGLSRQSQELDLALDRSIERVDAETLRANRAENTLQEVDRRVDVVNERIIGLQQALSDLSEVTAR